VLAAVKVPARLDTTETGFHTLTLSEPTREYLNSLTQPVTAYTTYPEDAGRVAADVRRLLAAMHDVNPTMFRVRYLSPTLNRNDIDVLRNRFPQVDPSLNGILLTVGEEEKQYAFIRTSELTEQDFSDRRPKVSFQGEKKVVGELLFLSENKTRAAVYFLSGHGELDVIPPVPGAGPQVNPRPATRLRAALDRSGVDVRPLNFERTDPKVPDDAAIVVVADPRAAIPPDQLGALRKYMAPRQDGKKGRLIVLAGPAPNPDGSGILDTGLNALLADFGVSLGGRIIYGEPVPQPQLGFTDFIGLVARDAAEARNPIAMEYLQRGAVFWNCQEVIPARGMPGAPFEAKLLFGSYPDDRITWLEETPPANPMKILSDMTSPGGGDLARQKQARQRGSRLLATVVSEGASGRVAVFGSGDAFGDDARRVRTVDANARLITLTMNWLRERPSVANIANKPYGLYLPNEKTSEVQVFWLPVGVTLMGVIALGLGVWVFRRK
jgi:hypothetical protein